MGMSRSTYYFEINKIDVVEQRNKNLLAEISNIFEYHEHRYGVRRVYQELLKRGIEVNHKRVQRLMHCAGLFGKRPKEKYHSYKGDVGKVADNIINRDFSTKKPLQKWTTDVSQFNLPWGKCYISPILDMNTNPEVLNMLKVLSKTMDQINKQTTEQYDWQMRIQICCIKLFVWRERYRFIIAPSIKLGVFL